MKKSRTVMSILFIGLLSLSGCTKKSIEGTVVSLPVSFSLNAAMDGRIDKLNFSGNIIEVKLSNREIVKAYATKEQMEQISKGKNQVTLEKTDNEARKDIKWKVIKLEEKKKQQGK